MSATIKKLHPVISLFVLCLCAVSTWSQSQISSADLKGTIADSSQAVISGATVTATNTATGLARTTTSDAQGEYRIPLLPPGTYDVKVEMNGFASQLIKGLTLTVGQTAAINFELKVGEISNTIEIEGAEAPVIETERVHQAETLTQKPINNLPINGRRFLDFALLTPGVVQENPAVTSGLLPQIPTSQLSFAGQGGRANSVTIDGADNNDLANNGVRPTISQEAVQEFQINRSSFTAEFGRSSGGLINIVSKGGTNDFHFKLFHYLRNESLDARNTFATSFKKDPKFKRNQPGFTFGGPLIKDRTFIFGSYEGLFQRESYFTTILTNQTDPINPAFYAGQSNNPVNTSADPRLRPTTGQVSLIQLLNSSGLGLIQQGTTIGGAQGQALVTQGTALVTQARTLATLLTTSPNSPALSQSFPALNRTTFNYLAASTGAFPRIVNSSVGSLRLDHKLNDHDQLLFRSNLTNDARNGIKADQGTSAPSNAFNYAIRDFAFVGSETHTFGPRAFNEFRAQFVNSVFNVDPVDPYGPKINIAEVGGFGRDYNVPSRRTQKRFQFADNFSYTAGVHNLKFGADINRVSFDTVTDIFTGGTLSFTQLPIQLSAVLGSSGTAQLVQFLASTNNLSLLQELIPVCRNNPTQFPVPTTCSDGKKPEVLSALSTIQQVNLGFMQTLTQGFGNPRASLISHQLAFYAQDNWTISPNLTFNFGLRYDFEAQPEGVPRDKNNFGPRFGFAWNPFKNSKTVIRGGAGIYYQPLFIATAFASKVLGKDQQITSIFVSPLTPAAPGSVCGNNPSIPASFCFFNALVSQGILTLPSSRVIPEAAWQQLLGFTRATSTNRVVQRLEDNAKNPYSIQASFGIDQQLGRDWNLSVNYLMNRGVRLLWNRQVNALPNPNDLDPFGRPRLTRRANPNLLVDYSIETAGNSIYHGLATSLTKRFSQHYQVVASYTYGKAIDDNIDINQNFGPQNPLNTRDERSRSIFDVRHRLSIAGVLDSPFKNFVLRDWTVAPIITASSGYPFNLITDTDVNGDTQAGNERPYTVGRNTGTTDGYFTTDLRLARRFGFGSGDSGRYVEFIAEGFNLFNRVNFKDVNQSTGGLLTLAQAQAALSARGYKLLLEGNSRVKASRAIPATSFSGYTSAFDPRIMQFAVKVNF